jgi:hypothetical protein
MIVDSARRQAKTDEFQCETSQRRQRGVFLMEEMEKKLKQAERKRIFSCYR